MHKAVSTSYGLNLARQYYEEVGLPMLQRSFPDLLSLPAAGRVGEGSECFGFDDHLSRDHDFGPGFCIWVEDALWAECGHALQEAYWSLPATFSDCCRPSSKNFASRVGPMPISRFYAQFLGRSTVPQTESEWFSIPQEPLAVCTNGEVFSDPRGIFTEIRTQLLSYYPEEVRLKKLAAHCALAAQAGQYNFPRCLKRGEHSAAIWTLSQFLYHYTAAVFLLNRRYMPFGKWAFHAMQQLPVLGAATAPILESLSPEPPEVGTSIETVCHMMIFELQKQGLSDASGSFLLSHADSIQQHLTHPLLAALPLMSWRSGWQ